MKRIDGWVNMIPTFLGWRLWPFLLLVDVDFLARPLKVSGVGIATGAIAIEGYANAQIE